MKKTTTTKRKTVKAAKATKTTKVSKVAKTTKPVKISKPLKPAPVVTDTPAWVKVVAIILILLGYAVYRMWSIATVNGQSISRLAHYKAMSQQVGQQTLENMITEALITDAARKQNYVVDQKLIDDKIATIEAQIKSQGQTLDQALEAENITLDEVKRQFGLQQIVDTLGRGDVTVTQAEIDQYITDNKANLPQNVTGDELQNIVKSQLESQKANTNIGTWLEGLKANANIVRW